MEKNIKTTIIAWGLAGVIIIIVVAGINIILSRDINFVKIFDKQVNEVDLQAVNKLKNIENGQVIFLGEVGQEDIKNSEGDISGNVLDIDADEEESNDDNETSLRRKYGNFNSEDFASLEVRGHEVYMNDVINDGTFELFKRMLAENPQVDTLVEVDMPGSENDDEMIDLAYFVREQKLNTKLISSSRIASGAVDLFLAGIERTMEYGATIGVHSWEDEKGMSAAEYPEEAEEHDENVDYVYDMLGTEDFYWFTIYAAAADDLHMMSVSEIEKYKLLTKPIIYKDK